MTEAPTDDGPPSADEILQSAGITTSGPGLTAVEPDAEDGPSPLRFTDDWLATVLVSQYGDVVRYCPKFGYWLAWDGQRWRECADSGPIRQLVRTIARSLPEDDKDAVRAKNRACSRGGIDAAVALAQGDPKVVVEPEQLDAHPWELNTPGGIVDLRTGKLLPHDPAKLHTRIAAATPDACADASMWTRFLEVTFPGDAELVSYMCRLAGYSAVGEVRDHVLPFCYGDGGNGKGVFLEALYKILGEYAGKAKRGFLSVRAHDPHPEEIANLAGRRFVLVSETNEADKFDEGKVKELTGGDTLTGRQMYGKSFSFEPAHTLWLMGNHRPKVESGGRSFWRRAREIPFLHKVPEEQQIPDLQNRLVRDHGDALMAWIVQGAVEYYQGGLQTPQSVIDATAEYQRDQDTVKRFLEECCHVGGGKLVKVLKDTLRSEYEKWCRSEGLEPVNSMSLGKELRGHGIDSVRSNSKSFYINVGLAATEEDEGASWGR
ncbi:DNA primase family protein [Streptomonospora salina]|uniref:DNA primase family protein n=1 Tax=Streptomonospora salina TaxID=104205 RepID=UPI0031EFA030